MTATGSRGSSQASASATERYCGASTAGMPSLGGPPERIRSYGTVCRLKSVLNWRVAPGGGDSSGSSSTLPAGAGTAASDSPPAPAVAVPAAARIRARTTASGALGRHDRSRHDRSRHDGGVDIAFQTDRRRRFLRARRRPIDRRPTDGMPMPGNSLQ